MEFTDFYTAIGDIMTDIGDVFSGVLEMTGTVADTISNNPVLFLFVAAVPLVGIAVGLFNRIVRSN